MRDVGRACESAACGYLAKKGYKIIARNYTVKGGELDIIAENKDFIVFVEVKARKAYNDEYGFTSPYGRPSDAVNTDKMKHMRQAANAFIREHGYKKKTPRNDVMEIGIHEYDGCVCLEINHIENAF